MTRSWCSSIDLKKYLEKIYFQNITITDKLVYNDHPWDPKIVAVADNQSLFRGYLSSMSLKWELKNSGRYRHVVTIWRWLFAHVRL
jgi:hypothetical protein